MKGRPFLAVVLAIALLGLGLGLGGWVLVLRRSPLALQHQALSLPRAARFVPSQAPLSLFLGVDGEQPVGYARAVAPIRARRQAAEAVERLRDGAFAAAGLNYRDELASWLAPGIALALFDGAPPPVALDTAAPSSRNAPAPGGWLLALSSRDDAGARRFLQRFWQTRSLAGTDLQVSRYRGMGLISGRGALVGSEPVPLATALVDDDLVLIASGRGVLEQALDVSQIDELNLAGQPRLQQGLARLGEGVGVLLARPAALERWLGLPPAPAAAGEAPTGPLLAALRPEGRSLALEALLELAAPLPLAPADAPAQRALLAGLAGQPRSLALVQDPAALLAQPLLAPLLRRALLPAEAGGPLPELVAAGDGGPLLAALGPQGWQFGTPAEQPAPQALEAALAAEGLIAAPLELGERSALVWTRLSAADGRPGRRAGADQLQASLAGWRTASPAQAWWGSSLALLEARPAGAGAAPALLQRLEALQEPQAPLRWALAAAPARELLQPWRPWRLLTALAGGGPQPPVGGLALALEPEGSSLRLRARLELGSADG
ncbi:MAG: DUF3352 domain-containing protein [Synechococcaceae cyanobacterium]|nr:DUF3352 domain-containing protein [Synechococcaceae cyanobacterium]